MKNSEPNDVQDPMPPSEHGLEEIAQESNNMSSELSLPPPPPFGELDVPVVSGETVLPTLPEQ